MYLGARSPRRAVALVWLLLFLVLAGCGRRPAAPLPADGAKPPHLSAPQTGPAVGQRAPSINARDAITGEPVLLAALQGRVVILNFWATWCTPCRVEMPYLEAIHREMKKDEVRVLALDVDDAEGPDKIAPFVKEMELSFPVAYDGGEAAFKYQVVGVPTTFFIDATGVIRVKHQGPMTPDQIREHIAAAQSAHQRE